MAIPAVPPAPGRVRIIDRTRIPSPDPARIGKYDEIITYQDQALRTYILTIPAEELEGKTDIEQLDIITERIRAQVQERLQDITVPVELRVYTAGAIVLPGEGERGLLPRDLMPWLRRLANPEALELYRNLAELST